MTRNSLIIFLCLTTIICINALAKDTYQDVVYLKNGSIIHGMIIEQIPEKSIKIQTENHDILSFSFDEIEKITKESVSPKKADLDKNSELKPPSSPNAFYYGNLRLGILIRHNSNVISFSMVNGLRFGDSFSLGIGLGYDSYPNKYAIPIFLDARTSLLKRNISPFLFSDLGYSAVIDDGSNYGGLLMHFGTGVTIHTNNFPSIIFELGYKMQKAKVWYSDLYWYYDGNPPTPHYYYQSGTRSVKYDFISLSIGVSF